MVNSYYYYGKYLRPYIRNEPQKTYSIIGMSLLTVMIFGIFAIAPTLKNILETREDLKSLIELSNQLSTKIDSLKEARITFAKVKPYSKALDEQLYPFSGWGKEIENIGTLADKESLQIAKIDPGVIIDNEGLMILEISGDYIKIKSFMTSLQKNHLNYKIHKLGLEKVDISSDKKEKSPLSLDNEDVVAEIVVKVLFLN